MNNSAHSTLEPLVYNDVVIRDDGDTLSLTDMWRAGGSDPAQQPSNWLSSADATNFMAVFNDLNPRNSGVKTKKGKNGGTLAHWQIGLAYAKYLSPKFHMWCNTIVRNHMENMNQQVATSQYIPLPVPSRVDAISQEVRTIIGGITKDVLHKQLAEIIPKLVMAALASHTSSLRRGETAGQIWRRHGFPPIRISCWFSRRLENMQCSIADGGRAEIGGRTVKLFDPDKADIWLKNGGKSLVEIYLKERLGQKPLHLVGGHGEKPKTIQ